MGVIVFFASRALVAFGYLAVSLAPSQLCFEYDNRHVLPVQHLLALAGHPLHDADSQVIIKRVFSTEPENKSEKIVYHSSVAGSLASLL